MQKTKLVPGNVSTKPFFFPSTGLLDILINLASYARVLRQLHCVMSVKLAYFVSNPFLTTGLTNFLEKG